MSNKARRVPKWLQALRQAQAEGKLGTPIQPGEVREITTYHDNWCAMFKGGVCNCNPVVKPGLPHGPSKLMSIVVNDQEV